MNKIKLLIPLIVLLFNSGCASIGPTVRIETPEPAEDFVLICEWHSDSLLNFFSSSVLSKRIIHVVKSGEETPCGIAWTGGRSNVRVEHPVYWEGTKNEENGLTVYRFTGTKLDYLDKQKEKFEAGYWDEYHWPGSEYTTSIKPICGFGHQYFDFYREVKKVDYDYFKKAYYMNILNCYKKLLPELQKYDKSYINVPSAEKYIEKSWQREYWEKYNDK